MHDNDNTKTQFKLDRESIQDEMEEHRHSPKNLRRRKLGLPEIPFYLNDLRTPEEIKANKEFKRKCLDEAMRKIEQMFIARQLKKTTEE